MPINPVCRTSGDILAPASASASEKIESAVPPVWGQDAYVPAADESPYLDYSKPVGGGNKSVASTKSIYDHTPEQLATLYNEAVEISAALDTDGMTEGEIYNAVESVFAQILGKDFRQGSICNINTTHSDEVLDAYRRGEVRFPNNADLYFGRALKEHGLEGTNDASAMMDARGYMGLSDSEIRAAVRNKYPEVMTLRDTLVMTRELFELGLEKYPETFIKNQLMYRTGINNVGIQDSNDTFEFIGLTEKLFDTLFDLPADYEVMRNLTYRIAEGGYTYLSEPVTDREGLSDKILSVFSRRDLYSETQLDELYDALGAIFDKGYWDTYNKGYEVVDG